MAGNASCRIAVLVRAFRALALVTALTMGAWQSALATAEGPDAWAVTGVRAGGVLNIRAEPSARAAKIGRVPHDGRNLTNLGCTGEPTYMEWEKMSTAQRERVKQTRWCRIGYQGVEGWVLGIYLRGDG